MIVRPTKVNQPTLSVLPFESGGTCLAVETELLSDRSQKGGCYRQCETSGECLISPMFVYTEDPGVFHDPHKPKVCYLPHTAANRRRFVFSQAGAAARALAA